METIIVAPHLEFLEFQGIWERKVGDRRGGVLERASTFLVGVVTRGSLVPTVLRFCVLRGPWNRSATGMPAVCPSASSLPHHPAVSLVREHLSCSNAQ